MNTRGGVVVPAAARPRVQQSAERLLIRADAAGVLPTPLDQVAASAGIEEVLDLSALPAPLMARKPSFLKRVVGALWYREQVAFVDYSQVEVRARFTEAHEIAHRALPWHRQAHELSFDDEPALDAATEDELEAEANLMAAHLLFQGRRFHERAVDYELSLAAPVLLADQFGTSLHATIRYYVEHHPEPLALAVLGQIRRADGSVPVWTAVESPNFAQAHGPFADWFPACSLVLGEGEGVRPLGRVALHALQGEREPTVDLRRRRAGDELRYKAEAFYNKRCIFLLVVPRDRFRLGRRVRLAS